jgi:hypothetical protein
MQELNFVRAGRLEWRERPDPELVETTDALVRPFVASRCDGDVLPVHRPVSRAMQAGLTLGLIDGSRLPATTSPMLGAPSSRPCANDRRVPS